MRAVTQKYSKSIRLAETLNDDLSLYRLKTITSPPAFLFRPLRGHLHLRAKGRLRRLRSETRLRAQPPGEGIAPLWGAWWLMCGGWSDRLSKDVEDTGSVLAFAG